MPKADWKAPFLRFRDQVRPLFDANVKLYHGILMTPFHKKGEIKEVIKNLAAADLGQPLALTIETPTEDCKYHAQFFYGESSTCSLLGEALSGIEDWIRRVPKGLLPEFDWKFRVNTKDQLSAWTDLVYYLAWEVDAPYLQATVEYQSRIHDVSSFEWSSNPWPETCDPRPLLIRQGNSSNRFTEFLETFSDKLWCPDVIGAYLRGEPFCGDLIGASLAAVDVLVFMLEQNRGQEAAKQNERPARRRPTQESRVTLEVKLLKGFLRMHHDPRETGDVALIPLTAKQIAEHMQWCNPDGEPVQSRASRRMEGIFGPDAMKKYKRAFLGDIDRLRDLLDDEKGAKRGHRRLKEG